jgi:hypothetical protein
MRRSIHGVYQLGQALRDFADGDLDNVIRAVDEDGHVRRLADSSADQTVNDIYLRREFPPPGKAKAARPGDTPTDRYNHALSALETALQSVDHSFAALTKVVGDDGQSLVEMRGVEPRLTDAWRELLRRVDEEMVILFGRVLLSVFMVLRLAYRPKCRRKMKKWMIATLTRTMQMMRATTGLLRNAKHNHLD